MNRASAVAVLLLGAPACGGPEPAGRLDAARQELAAKRAPPVEAEAPAAIPERGGLLSAIHSSLQETRAITRAYAEGTLGDRLVGEKLLIVDAKAPKGTDQAQYVLLAATFTGPTNTGEDLIAAVKDRQAGGQRVLVGGEDGDRPGLFRKVAPGKYLACAAVGPASTPEKQAYLAAAKAALGDADQARSDAAKLAEAARQAQAQTGYKPTRIAWETVAARCKQVEVTQEPGSRVVVLEPAAG